MKKQPVSPRVFVVDDDPEFLNLAATLLELEGYQVDRFENPQLAYQAFCAAEPRPAALVSDCKMAPWTGEELAERCRQVNPRLGVLLISGFVLEAAGEQYPVADAFLTKPFLAETYLATVAAVLTKQELEPAR
ncbi:MAG TPA: response regulator [Verrucomicrobiae bacterium]|nr:response regulator [Verrucomicrobiae bacterium]